MKSPLLQISVQWVPALSVTVTHAIVYFHNPQIPSENTAKLCQQIWVQISTNYGAISLTLFLFLVRGCFRKSDSRANTNTFHSKVVAHFLAFPWSKLLCISANNVIIPFWHHWKPSHTYRPLKALEFCKQTLQSQEVPQHSTETYDR